MIAKENKFLKSALVLIMAAVITFSFVYHDSTAVYLADDEIDTSEEREQDLENKIAALQKEQDDLKEKINSASSEKTSQLQQKQYLDSLAQSTQAEIDATEALIAEYEANIVAKTDKINKIEKDIEDNYELVLKILAFSYEEGTTSYVELLLDAESLENFLVSEERVASILEYDKKLISEMNENLKTVEDEKAALNEAKAAQEILKANLDAKKAQLEKESQDVANYISQLESDSAAYAQQLAEAKADEEKLNAEIEELLKERQRKRKSSFSGGYFEYPLPNEYHRVSSPYGWRNIFGYNEFHLGVDLPAPYGTPVYAAADGEIIWASYKGSYGYCVMIDHGGGYATLYAHNSSIIVSVGDEVKKGETISKVGSTGNSTGNHLHFEVRINGKTVNPLSYVTLPG